MAKNGRKVKEHDWKLAESLALIFCSQAEIASILKTSPSSLTNALQREFKLTWSEWYEKASAQGKTTLRRQLFQKAQEGNVPILIWLSKNYLGMKEPAVELAQRTIEKEQISELDDRALEAVARKILQEGNNTKGGLRVAS